MLRSLVLVAKRYCECRHFMTAVVLSSLLPATLVAFAAEQAPGKLTVHGQITHDALQGTLAETNLKALIDANDSQDITGDGAQEKRRHFDAASMTAALNYVNREKNRALDLAAEADTDMQSRADALRHIGLMLHTVQDFYLRSNYVETEIEDPQIRQAPYDMPLVDWSKLPGGYTKIATAKQGDESDPLNKERPDSEAGKKIVSGKATQFNVARELAIRETQRQWNLFEALVRNRCGTRAPAVIAALRQAAPEGYASPKPTAESSDYQ